MHTGNHLPSYSPLNPCKPFRISTRSEDSVTCLLIASKDFTIMWKFGCLCGKKETYGPYCRVDQLHYIPIKDCSPPDLYPSIVQCRSIVNIIMSLSSGQLNDLPLICKVPQTNWDNYCQTGSHLVYGSAKIGVCWTFPSCLGTVLIRNIALNRGIEGLLWLN